MASGRKSFTPAMVSTQIDRVAVEKLPAFQELSHRVDDAGDVEIAGPQPRGARIAANAWRAR
jgi:hypothetical protein